MPRTSPQLLCFSYHKTGTSLLLHVMTKVTARLGLTLVNRYGLVKELDAAPDVLLLPHSLLRVPLAWAYRACRMVRDPRDIWVSGYLYHRHCEELWCRNTDFDPTTPIGWPRVDYSFAHRSEDWKRAYLRWLNGRSYQQNLLDRSLADGLAFELQGYTGCTLAALADWHLNGVAAMDVKLEDVMSDFDATMLRVFRHFGLTPEQQEAALEVARSEDVRRMDDDAMATRPQIYSRTISKWRDILTATQIGEFEARYGVLITGLGYELSNSKASRPREYDVQREPASRVVQAPDIRLSVDGRSFRPVAVARGESMFIVPAGARRVCLQPRPATASDWLAATPGDACTSVTVCRLTVRRGPEERVIAADDPGLVVGWHPVERSGEQIWRATDGEAAIPWSGEPGPAILTVHLREAGEGREEPASTGTSRCTADTTVSRKTAPRCA